VDVDKGVVLPEESGDPSAAVTEVTRLVAYASKEKKNNQE